MRKSISPSKRFNNGWVKLHRSAIEGDIGSNYMRLGFFCTLLSWANLRESTIVWDGLPRVLNRGEIVTSLKQLAKQGECDPKTITRLLNYFSLRQTIKVEKSFGGVFIKINNYDQYQLLDAGGSEVSPKLVRSSSEVSGYILKKERIKEVKNRPNFKNLRELIIQATKKFGPYEQEGMSREIDKDWEWVSRSGLIGQIRNMPRHDLTDHFKMGDLEKSLEAAYDSFQSRNQKTGDQ